MSEYFDAFDADRPLRMDCMGCSCGRHASAAAHAAAIGHRHADHP